MKYDTKQREVILNYFILNKEKCITARDIIADKDVNVGEATIYRCLSMLTQEGQLKKYVTGRSTSYQYNGDLHCSNHFHLRCLNCSELVHMDCSFMEEMEKHIESEHSFTVDNSKTVLFGICEKCRK